MLTHESNVDRGRFGHGPLVGNATTRVFRQSLYNRNSERPLVAIPKKGRPPREGTHVSGSSDDRYERHKREFRPSVQLPDGQSQSSAMIPYFHHGGNAASSRRRRHRNLNQEGNFALVSTASANVRRRAECRWQREEARAIWMRLRHPAPDGPFDPTGRFPVGYIRIETIRYTHIEIAVVLGLSAACRRLRTEMPHISAATRNQCYMHRWSEYQTAYEQYANTVRDYHHDFPCGRLMIDWRGVRNVFCVRRWFNFFSAKAIFANRSVLKYCVSKHISAKLRLLLRSGKLAFCYVIGELALSYGRGNSGVEAGFTIHMFNISQSKY